MLETIRISGGDTPSGVVIFLHGLGAGARDIHGPASKLDLPAGIEIVLPQAPTKNVTLAGGLPLPAWFDIYGLERNSKEDKVGIINAQQEIQQLIDSLKKTYSIDSHNIVIGGFSQGGALALYCACHSHEPLAGAFALSAYLPLRQTLGTNPAGLVNHIPIFLGHGVHDDVVPLNYGEIAHNLLQRTGFDVTWRPYPLAHEVNMNVINDVSKWICQIIAMPV